MSMMTLTRVWFSVWTLFTNVYTAILDFDVCTRACALHAKTVWSGFLHSNLFFLSVQNFSTTRDWREHCCCIQIQTPKCREASVLLKKVIGQPPISNMLGFLILIYDRLYGMIIMLIIIARLLAASYLFLAPPISSGGLQLSNEIIRVTVAETGLQSKRAARTSMWGKQGLCEPILYGSD